MKNTKPISYSTIRRQYLTAITTVAAAMLASEVKAATFTWDGGGGNNRWDNGVNWVGDAAPNNDGTDDIVMDGSTRLSNRANGGWDINSLTFAATAGAFTITGFTLDEILIEGGGVLNNSVNTQTINNNILIGADQAWDASSGNLVFGGSVNLFSSTVTVTGASTTTLGNVVSGIGSIVRNGSGTLTLSGANTFAGGVTVNSGTLGLANNAGAGSGAITLNGGSLVASGGTRTVANSVGFGGGSVGGANNLEISGSVSGAIIMNGSGVLTLSGANNPATSAVINSGTVSLASNGALGSAASVTLNSGGALNLTGSSGNLINDLATLTLAGGILNAQSHTETMGTLSLSPFSSSTINLVNDSTAGVLTFASAATGSGATLTINNWSSGDDQIFISSDPGGAFLAAITFTGYGAGAYRFGTGEIVPLSVPEPTTVAAALGLLGFALSRFYTRRAK